MTDISDCQMGELHYDTGKIGAKMNVIYARVKAPDILFLHYHGDERAPCFNIPQKVDDCIVKEMMIVVDKDDEEQLDRYEELKTRGLVLEEHESPEGMDIPQEFSKHVIVTLKEAIQ